MDKGEMMPVKASQATMWTLSEDRWLVRLVVPPLPIAGMPEPLAVYMDFNAKSVDAMIERLTVLRSQMLPPLSAPGTGTSRCRHRIANVVALGEAMMPSTLDCGLIRGSQTWHAAIL